MSHSVIQFFADLPIGLRAISQGFSPSSYPLCSEKCILNEYLAILHKQYDFYLRWIDFHRNFTDSEKKIGAAEQTEMERDLKTIELELILNDRVNYEQESLVIEN